MHVMLWHVWSWPFQGALPRRFLRHMGLVLRLAEWTTERLVDLYEPLGCFAVQQESYFWHADEIHADSVILIQFF